MGVVLVLGCGRAMGVQSEIWGVQMGPQTPTDTKPPHGPGALYS